MVTVVNQTWLRNEVLEQRSPFENGCLWTVVRCFTENRSSLKCSSCSLLDFVSWLTWVQLNCFWFRAGIFKLFYRHIYGATFRLSLNASVETDDQCRLPWNCSYSSSGLHFRFKFCCPSIWQLFSNILEYGWKLISWNRTAVSTIRYFRTQMIQTMKREPSVSTLKKIQRYLAKTCVAQ